LVQEAVESGFRFIDTACQPKHYNEAGVGQGWTNAVAALSAKQQLKRSDLYLQTKFTPPQGQDPNNIPYDPSSTIENQVTKSLETSLSNLRTTYLDALLLHSPYNGDKDDTMKVWRTFESFVKNKQVLKLGISNCYDLPTFQYLYETSTIKPSILQNRFYSESNFDVKLRQYCKEKNVTYQSFWTLTANIKALDTTELKKLAFKKGLSPQTLMYAFMMSLDGHVTPLSGTTDKMHMAQDVEVMNRIIEKNEGEEKILKVDEMKCMANILGIPDL